MGKQPYIPFYIGDYLKDTRMLPLSVRGAWVDLILFMWDAPVRGEITGTLQEITRMIGCDSSEAKFALDLLKQKNTANINLLPSGEYQIISRRMKKDAEISAIRSEVGKKGVEARKGNKFGKPKIKQNTDNENEYDNEDESELEGVQGENLSGKIEALIFASLGDIYLDSIRHQWKHIDFDLEVESFKQKVRGSPEEYADRDSLRSALQYQLRNARKINGKPKTQLVDLTNL